MANKKTDKGSRAKENLLRSLPSVEELASMDSLSAYRGRCMPSILTEILRASVEQVRQGILKGHGFSGAMVGDDVGGLTLKIAKDKLKKFTKPSMKKVVNASGTVLHTNLGRAQLSQNAVEALVSAASNPVNLEFDIEKGGRGERDSHAEELLIKLTGAEAACIVNNNAAAVLISLNSLAEGREVIVSRGELVEIGGSFRLPEVIGKSGCNMREVGTTNRTHLKDYEKAVIGKDGSKVGVLFKAHTSNYEVVGFTSEVSLKELAAIGNENSIPVVEDLGSGSLIDLAAFGLQKEAMVRESIEAGADVVTFSGDKLLGGPQAGIIVGKKIYIDMIKQNPLKRALRVDKLTMAALTATLREYVDYGNITKNLPTLKYLTRDISEIEKLATDAKEKLSSHLGDGYGVTVEDSESQVGSGSLPGHTLKTKVLVVSSATKKPEEIYKIFLNPKKPILGRVHKEKFMLDVRAIDKAEDLLPLL